MGRRRSGAPLPMDWRSLLLKPRTCEGTVVPARLLHNQILAEIFGIDIVDLLLPLELRRSEVVHGRELVDPIASLA
jgi:hypothetical protein